MSAGLPFLDTVGAQLVAELTAGLREDEDGLYFERAVRDAVRAALARLDEAARRAASIPIVALALRVQAEAPGRALFAVAQLCRLVTGAGVAIAEVSEGASKLIGLERSARPVGGKVAGAQSPLDLLLKR